MNTLIASRVSRPRRSCRLGEHQHAERAEQAVDRGRGAGDGDPRVTEQLDGDRAAERGQQVEREEPHPARAAVPARSRRSAGPSMFIDQVHQPDVQERRGEDPPPLAEEYTPFGHCDSASKTGDRVVVQRGVADRRRPRPR